MEVKAGKEIGNECIPFNTSHTHLPIMMTRKMQRNIVIVGEAQTQISQQLAERF